MGKKDRYNPRRFLTMVSAADAGVESLSRVVLSFDRNAPPHAHPQTQVLLVLDGMINVKYLGRVWSLHAGDIIALASGQPHHNTGESYAPTIEFVDLRLINEDRFPITRFLQPRISSPVREMEPRLLKDIIARLDDLGAGRDDTPLPQIMSLSWMVVSPYAREARADAQMQHVQEEVAEPRLQMADACLRVRIGHRDMDFDDVARNVNLSLSQLHRLYRQHLGVTPGQRLKHFRLHLAKRLLRASAMSVKQISVACGFSNPAHFARVFHAEVGHAPVDYRRMPS